MTANHNPQNFVRVFVHYVRAMVEFLVWGTIGFVAITAAYVAARVVWVAAKTILQALGI